MKVSFKVQKLVRVGNNLPAKIKTDNSTTNTPSVSELYQKPKPDFSNGFLELAINMMLELMPDDFKRQLESLFGTHYMFAWATLTIAFLCLSLYLKRHNK